MADPTDDDAEDSARLQQNFQNNQPFVKPGAQNFNTPLQPQEESQFRQWVGDNKVPFSPDAIGPNDYDMRGFWKGMQSGDPNAKNAVDPNDNKLHYPDYWKTPYHETFSNESQWANPATAPKWNDQDQLVAPSGAVRFDDRAHYGPPPVETTSRGDDLNPNQGYRGPSNIGSWSQSVGAVPGAVASGVGAGLDQLAGAPAGHGENAFTVPQDSGLWKNFTDGLKTSDSANETELRQFSLQDSVDQARDNINKAAGVDLPNPFVGAFAASPTAMQDYQRSLEELLAKHQENTPGDKAIRDAVEPALNMNDYADQWVKDAQSKSEMDLAKSNGSLFPWLAQHAGQMVGAFRNPINALGLLVGGPELGLGGSAVGRILQEGASQAAIQMGLTGVQEQSRQARAAQLGGETGFWPAIHDLEDSAIGGFIGGGVIRSLHEIGSLFRPADQGVATEEFLRRAQDIPPPGGWPAGSESRGQAWRREMDEWQAQQSASKGAVVPYEGPPGDAMGFSVEEGEAAPPESPPQPPVNQFQKSAASGQPSSQPSRPVTQTPPPDLNTPPEIGNLPRTTAITPTAIERAELDAAAAPKVPADNTAADALETYAGLLRSGEFPDQIGKPVLPPSTPPALPASDPNSLILPSVSETKVGQSFIKDDKPVTREDFDPTKLQTNADVFQYKGGGNAQGVTDRLKGVGMWDPIAGADPMVVYRWNDGREDVVNGHQRTGLARALDAQGSLPEGTTSPGFVFKEADGWTPADVRAYAAKVNLMQGSGDVLDTARILRDRPDIWDKALPTSEPKLKQAKGLAELSDDGWGMVVNGHVKPDLAALVGQGIPDKSAHTSMLQSIIDFKKADQNSTRMMIADANAAGFHEENQADIFGTAPVTKNLLQERAAVYSRVVTALREDKNVFRTLDREADRIEAAGNVLASDTNRNNADRAEQLGSILEKLAVRQGPISAALNRAAAGVAERGGKGADVAARQFLRDIDRLVREEGLKLTAPPEIEPRANIDITTPLGQDQSVEELRQSTASLSDDIFGSHPKTIPDQRQAIFEDVRQKLLDADMPRVQAEANAAVMAARYVARASRLGRTDPETLYREQGITVRGDSQRAEGKTPAKEGDKAFNQPATVPTFYSSVARAVDNAKLNKASPEQWLATLKNLPAVRPEEVKWLGLEDWLKGQKGSVTKADVADYVRANQIEVNEVNKGDDRDVTPFLLAQRDGLNWDDLSDAERRSYGVVATSRTANAAKFPGYTLPGGENYREMLLTLPSKQLEDFRAGKRSDISENLYKSSHWDEPNVLAHIRFDDREMSGGRVLHLAEVQSDWHQAGRRSGYKPRNPDPFEQRPFGEVPDAPFKTTWPELSMKRMIRYAAENGYDRITWDTGKTNAERYDLSKQVDRVSYAPETQHLRAFKDGDVVLRKVVAPEKLADEIGKDAAEKLLKQPLHAEKATGATGFRSENVHVIEGEDLKVGGSGMEGFYDKMLPAAVDKLTKKFGGKTGWARVIHDEKADIHQDVPFDVTDAQGNVVGTYFDENYAKSEAEKIGGTYDWHKIEPIHRVAVPVHSLKLTPELKDAAINEGFPLFAKASEGEARGRITMRDDSAVIDLFKKRNASTFMHEAGHKFLEEMASDAGEKGAPKQIKDDFKEILDWLGAKDAESIGEKEHEKFARGFEQYLRDGKAPSEGLRRAFEQFKEWLRSIYRTLVGLGKEIPDNIRAVMDRMIATDDEIAAARAGEHEQLRTAPPTQQEAASAQLEGGIRDVATQVHDALRADGTPIDHEIADAIVKELKPAPVEPGSTPPEREPAPRPGTKLDKTVDLRSSGLRPKGRGDGASSISAAQVAWSTAIQNKKPALAGIGAYGWKVLKPTEGLPYGNPYVEVTPEGVARFYGTDLQAGEKASSPNDAFQKKMEAYRQERAKASALVDEALAKPNPSLMLEKGADKLVLSRSTSGPYPLRMTTIDKDGPVGHRDYKETDRHGVYSMDAEVDSALREGYTVRPATERTAAGDQTVMPGVAPVTDADRAQAGAAKPLRGGDRAPPAGGLFDEDAKAQVDWMDLVPTDDGLVPANELREELQPQTPEEKTFFQSVKTPEELAIQRRQKAINLKVQQDLVKHYTTSRTIDGRRDIINANYNLFEDFGYSGHPSVRFIAEALVARSNQQIAAALEHFKRKTFYSNGPLGLAGTRNNRADLHELRKAMGGEKTTPEMQKLAQDMRVMLDDGLRLFNEASGGTIGYLKNWVPQNHNPAAIYRAGGLKDPLQAKAAWIKYIDPLLNWNEMRDTQTGAFLKGLSEAQRGAILDWTWKTIVTDGSLQDRPGGHRLSPASVANSRSDHRFFIFKDADSQSDYDKNYGGGDFLTQLLTHSRMMARDTALMRVFGTNPANMIAWAKDGIVKEAAKAAVREPSLLEGYDKMSAKQLLAKAARAGKVIDGYYAQFRGNGYEQGAIALAGTVLRNIETSALLGKSVIPHAVANPLIQMMGRYYGKVPVMQTLPHLAQAFQAASKEEMLRSGLDVENGAYSLGESARYIGTLERVANASRWLPDRVTAWSGLHPFVEAMRGTLRRGMVANLADLQKTDWDALPAWTLRKLQGYGVTERDWKIAQLADLYEPALGSAKWLRPADIEAVGDDGPNGGAAQRIASAIGFRPADMFMTPQEEAALKKLPFDAALKIGGYINGETEVAVPTSSMRMRASLVGDSDPNTLWGQLRLSTVMFKGFIASFMLSQLQANARLAADHAPSALNWKVGRNRLSLKHAAFLTIAMSLAGTLAFILKQMASGKEIPSLDPMSPEGRKTWEHGVLTGGAFGYLGDFLASQQSSYGRGPLETLAGPAGAAVIGAGGSAWDAFTSATTKRGPARSKKTMEQKAVENMFFAARNNTPFGNLWYGQAAFNRMVLDQLQQMADPSAHQEAVQAQQRLMKESNQKFWWNPGDILPHEWPWQHGN